MNHLVESVISLPLKWYQKDKYIIIIIIAGNVTGWDNWTGSDNSFQHSYILKEIKQQQQKY